jgi:hypothetical protein
MAILSKGTDFTTGDQVTAANLDALVDNATFATGAVDDTTTALDSSSPKKIIVKDGGIGTAQLADSSSKTTGVTFAKMQHVSTAQVLGRVSASEGDVEEVGVVIGGSGDAGLLFDNDDMLDNSDTAGGSATRGATQQSIKAYVDSAPVRCFSKPDFIGSFAAIPATSTDVTVTHNLGTTDLIYFIQMKLPSGAITQMNPALTFPYDDTMKPAGLSVFIETNTFSCRSGAGWAFWREQGSGTGSTVSHLDNAGSRSGYEFRIIAYKLS